jgi:hypothetical protein
VYLRHPRIAIYLGLVALCIAQSVAMVHALSHLGGRDMPSAPGQHTTVCTDCVAHAPLLVTGGATAVVFLVALQSSFAVRPRAIRAPQARTVHRAFRSRAPPR